MFTCLVLILLWASALACDDPYGEPTVDLQKGTDGKRIEIRNSCSFGVDLGYTGGFAGAAIDGECLEHQENDGSGRCFWSLSVEDYLESEDSVVVELRSHDDSDVIWSGAVFGLRSPFMDDACPGGKCRSFQGPIGTVNLAEFTMLKEGTVFYDVSNIHGVSIPTSMGPRDGISIKHTYRDGIAGECSWDFNPPERYRKYLVEVKRSHGDCEKDEDCGHLQVCGTSLESGEPNHGTCGEFFGYLNAHSNCIAGSTGYPFFCEKYHDLYACSGIYSQSGYTDAEGGPGVCGCSEYDDLNIVSSYPCHNTNPLWEEKAYKWIHYIKKGCPSAYEFQFSDSTSTFTSRSEDFLIEFCPGVSEEVFFAKL